MSKRIAQMQPYVFPYLGYFQLIAGVDEFVMLDNLQYVKQSWINRNRILLNGKDWLITFPLRQGGHLERINEKVFSERFPEEMEKLLRVLYNAYAKAPCYKTVYPLLEEIIRHPDANLARYAENGIRKICAYLDIRTPIVIASDLDVDPTMEKQDRVIATTRTLSGDTYINPIGGIELYDFAYFHKNGIELKFHKIHDIHYRQFGDAFIPFLSIIDVLMFNDVADVRRLLDRYSLLDASMCEQLKSPSHSYYRCSNDKDSRAMVDENRGEDGLVETSASVRFLEKDRPVPARADG